MRWSIVRVIAEKEVRAIARSRAIWVPMVIVSVVLFLVLPLAIGLVITFIPDTAMNDPEFTKLLEGIPPEVLPDVDPSNLKASFLALMFGQLMVPLFLIVPIMTASLMAADAFAGERERKTLEALLFSPATNLEIFAGKVAGAMVPAVVADVVGLVSFSLAADVSSYSVVGYLVAPTPLWIMTALVLGPAFATLSIVLVVWVSAKVTGFQEANQVAALLIIPIVFLFAGQMGGLFLLGPWGVLGASIVVGGLGGGLLVGLARRFTRESLFLKL